MLTPHSLHNSKFSPTKKIRAPQLNTTLYSGERGAPGSFELSIFKPLTAFNISF